jgi:hypothetical protein
MMYAGLVNRGHAGRGTTDTTLCHVFTRVPYRVRTHKSADNRDGLSLLMSGRFAKYQPERP